MIFAITLFLNAQGPELIVDVEKRKASKITYVKLETTVTGPIVDTTMTITFQNQYNRELEGTLYFPLPDGATVDGYGLDINGRIRDAVAVTKRKARVTFETILRQKKDPGIVEWTKGNVFKTRVYPLPANGQRTIRVNYSYKRKNDTVNIPLIFKDKIELDFILTINGKFPKQKIFGRTLSNNRLALNFRENTFNKNLKLNIPLKQKIIEVEQAPNGDYYYLIKDDIGAEKKSKGYLPSKIAIIWDASHSRFGKNERDKTFIKSYLKRVLELQGSAHVEFYTLRNKSKYLFKRLIKKDFDISVILAKIDQIFYDGGTSIGQINKVVNTCMADDIFLFSDGINTYHKDTVLTQGKRIYCFHSNLNIDSYKLKTIAMKSGALSFNLNNYKDEEIINILDSKPSSFIAINDENAFPSTVRRVHENFIITGKLNVAEKKIKLTFRSGEKVIQKEYVIKKSDAKKSKYVSKLWAQHKLEQLLILEPDNEHEIRQHGLMHRLVTPYTSLIVMETLSQYLQYDIERYRPPAY